MARKILLYEVPCLFFHVFATGSFAAGLTLQFGSWGLISALVFLLPALGAWFTIGISLYSPNVVQTFFGRSTKMPAGALKLLVAFISLASLAVSQLGASFNFAFESSLDQQKISVGDQCRDPVNNSGIWPAVVHCVCLINLCGICARAFHNVKLANDSRRQAQANIELSEREPDRPQDAFSAMIVALKHAADITNKENAVTPFAKFRLRSVTWLETALRKMMNQVIWIGSVGLGVMVRESFIMFSNLSWI